MASSYLVYPDGGCNTSLTKLTLKKASGKRYLDRKQQHRDTLSADLTFKGIPPGFSLADEQLMHLRFGNYAINSDANLVDYRGFQGRDLLMEF